MSCSYHPIVIVDVVRYLLLLINHVVLCGVKSSTTWFHWEQVM